MSDILLDAIRSLRSDVKATEGRLADQLGLVRVEIGVIKVDLAALVKDQSNLGTRVALLEQTDGGHSDKITVLFAKAAAISDRLDELSNAAAINQGVSQGRVAVITAIASLPGVGAGVALLSELLNK